MTSFTCIHTNGVYQQYKGNICNRAFKCGSELPEYVALILRNGGSQSPDRWLRELRNNQKYKEKFEELLGVLGYRLEMNDEYGVVQLTNALNTNRQNLKLYESVILLILRILFDEKKRELSVSDEVIVNLGDIQDKFLSLKIRDKMIDKTTMGNALRLFRRYQLIELLESDLKNEESRVLIYNSILMAVRVEDIKSVYEKVDSYRKGKLKDEEADQTETD